MVLTKVRFEQYNTWKSGNVYLVRQLKCITKILNILAFNSRKDQKEIFQISNGVVQ
jgi:hypothetical protein